MPDCFISYSTKDQWLASRIQSELEAHNVDVFMAPVSIQPGERWREALLRNMSASSCLLLLASKDVRGSDWVNQELGMAFQSNKRVIPVLVNIDPSELPGLTADVQAFSLTGTSEREIRDLSSKVAEIVREEKAKGPPEAAALLQQAIKLIEARAYEPAIDILNQAIRLAPLAAAPNYYLALASLKGRRPRLLYLSEADEISRYLERACTSNDPQAHYFYLWAIVKLDFYLANGLRVGEPDIEELFREAEDRPFHQDAFDQMVRHAEAAESLRSLGFEV